MATMPTRLPTRKRVLCTLAATAAATLIAGGGSAAAATIPTVFDFAAPVAGTVADNDGQGTGFESVQPNKTGTEYKPSLLDLAGGVLNVNSTTGDIGNPDTQDNALQVTFDGTAGYTVSSTLKGPLPIVAQANSFQSAGIFVGSDFDNYVKLVAGVSPTGPRLHMAFENAGVLKQKNIDFPVSTAGWVQLILTVGLDGKVTGKAIVDGTEVTVWTTPEALPGALSATAKAGIATTSANGQPSFKAPYENWAVMPMGQTLAPPVVGNVVAFKPKRTVIRGNKGAGGLVVPGFGEFGNRTLPTALAQNPLTGQLYVGTQFGKIYVFNLDANNNATLSSTINSIYDTANTTFDGSPEPTQKGRQVTGIRFAPTGENGNAVLYVTHSDPEIFEANAPGTSTVDPSSGMLTKLVIDAQGNVVSRADLIKGLPRSGENHGPNGMDWGPDGWLYVSLGGNTNNGAQSEEFSYFPETPLSASIIRVNPAAITSTIDASKGSRFFFTSPPAETYTLAGNASDNGTVPGKLELYATGFRNGYDLLWHTDGKLYTAENESNTGYGTSPGAADGCPGFTAVDQPTTADEFFLVHAGQYHGHPNPSRGECEPSGGVKPIATFSVSSSSTGVEEYTSNAFGNLLKGQVLVTNYAQGDNIVRLKLNDDGTAVTEKATLASNFSDPVNLLVAKDGAIFVAEHSNTGDSFAQVSVLEPVALACPKPGSPNVDSDDDGYLDSDETANGTNMCNPAEAPRDFDKDKISDLLDPDDDNDGVPDVTDRFQLDATNGAGTVLPWVQQFDQSDSGGYYGSGFGGVQLSSKGGGALAGKVSAGGAGGYLSITSTDGTLEGAANNQQNALQQGFVPNGPFEASVIVGSPFPGGPTAKENGGIFLGPDEDNYIRLAVHANGGSPVIELGSEQGGTFTRRAAPALPAGSSNVKLMLNGDPSSNRVRVRYQINGGEVKTIGTLTVPASWFASPMAAGLVTTKGGSSRETIAFVFDAFTIAAGPAVPPASKTDPDLGPGTTTTTDTTVKPPKPPTKNAGKVKLTIAQMRINQRISAAAIRRVAILEAFLEGRPAPKFPRVTPAKFELTVAQMAINQKIAQAAVRRVEALSARLAGRKPAKPSTSSGKGRITVTAAQMLINQRISQAAVRRVNALQAAVDAGARLP
ncbi:MAG: hypothetical protein QOD86_1667 [Miltoncostaeaceae bacterium]|jgi:glucose/arabinose dehydrogenase|nr:hypothetical protein [Miltoncostaeaceae bacterium]